MKTLVNTFNQLTKVRIAVLSTASAVTGYILAANGISFGALVPIFGVYLLASGAGALNEYQERDIDALMERTKNRPIPSGRITPTSGLIIAVALLVAGLACLSFDRTTAGLGLVTVLWYNVIYTPLKRVSAFAAIPGGVVGALPPMIGWVAGGGAMLDPRILIVAFFFFVWQVPHFWLLLMRIGDDYKRAGLPTLTEVFSRRQLARVTYVWMLATGVSCMLIPFFGVTTQAWVPIVFLAASLWLGWHATLMVRSDGQVIVFKEINIYALIVITLLSVSGLVA